MTTDSTPKSDNKPQAREEEAPRPFEAPKLQKRGKLPRVTTAFGGTFIP